MNSSIKLHCLRHVSHIHRIKLGVIYFKYTISKLIHIYLYMTLYLVFLLSPYVSLFQSVSGESSNSYVFGIHKLYRFLLVSIPISKYLV